MVFKVRTVYQKEDLQGMTRAYHYTKRPLRVMERLLSRLRFVLGVVLLLMCGMMLLGLPGVFRIAAASEDKSMFSLAVICVVTLLTFFASGLGMLWKSNMPMGAKLSWRLYKQKGEELRFQFDPYRFTLERPNVRSEYEYGLIRMVLEDGERFYLFDTERSAFVLPKRDLEQGTAEDFRTFISQVTGKTVEKIK